MSHYYQTEIRTATDNWFGRHIKYLKMAREMATRATGVHRHGCVIVSGGRILARGHNSYENGVHAEVNALSANWLSEFKGATLYVARLRKEQAYGLSLPCPACQIDIRKAGIKRVFFSTNDPDVPIACLKV
jgi:pyrimidine deaminase RibD-like protein